MSTASSMFGERFTHRLEAFSDLVFGFSLSVLATRLDIPADPSQVFEPTRWSTFIITFAIICILWLAHYRIFRHHFVPQIADVVINFVFLLGIAILAYAVQTFLRFTTARDAIILYFGDFALLFARSPPCARELFSSVAAIQTESYGFANGAARSASSGSFWSSQFASSDWPSAQSRGRNFFPPSRLCSSW